VRVDDTDCPESGRGWWGLADVAGRAPLVTVPAAVPSDLSLQCGLHRRLRAEAGNLLEYLWQCLVTSEQLIDVAADTARQGILGEAWA
jgi:hypothetical protein